MSNQLEVKVLDGKYTLIQDDKGKLYALRYGEPWRDCVGDGLICALGYELSEARDTIKLLEEDIKRFKETLKLYSNE